MLPFKNLIWVALMITAISAVKAGTQEGKGVTQSTRSIDRGAKFYVAPMDRGFDAFLVAALVKKQVPIVIVNDRAKADYEITGVADSEKAGWAKTIFYAPQSKEQASIKVTEIKSGEIVYGYAVHKESSYKGRQSSAEACAKHLREKIEKK